MGGPEPGPIEGLLQDYEVETVLNSRYKDGMLSSVQCGLKAVPDRTDAVMVLLGDQPMIEYSVTDKLIGAFRESREGIFIATHLGRRGHPILFSSEYIKEVTEFPEDESLKDLLDKYPEKIREIETGQAEILRDIDNEKDYMEELKHQNNHD